MMYKKISPNVELFTFYKNIINPIDILYCIVQPIDVYLKSSRAHAWEKSLLFNLVKWYLLHCRCCKGVIQEVIYEQFAYDIREKKSYRHGFSEGWAPGASPLDPRVIRNIAGYIACLCRMPRVDDRVTYFACHSVCLYET